MKDEYAWGIKQECKINAMSFLYTIAFNAQYNKKARHWFLDSYQIEGM